VILLKSDLENLSLTVVDEITLAVTISENVFPLVSKADLSSTHTGFGAIHSAVLSLGARVLASSEWAKSLLPLTTPETMAASTSRAGKYFLAARLHASSRRSPGGGNNFSQAVRERERKLRGALISYIGVICQITETDIAPILSPSLNSTRGVSMHKLYAASMPTIGNAITTLLDLTNDLSMVLGEVGDVDAGAAALGGSWMGVSELGLSRVTTRLGEAAAPAHAHELEHTAKTLLGSVEQLVLIIWRHLTFYIIPDSDFSNLPRGATKVEDVEGFKHDAARALIPVLDQVEKLELGSGEEGALVKWGGAKAYLHIMVVRCRIAVGVLEDGFVQ
jgi:nuclear pore complex protein Nup205